MTEADDNKKEVWPDRNVQRCPTCNRQAIITQTILYDNDDEVIFLECCGEAWAIVPASWIDKQVYIHTVVG